MNFSVFQKTSFKLRNEWKKILISIFLALAFWFFISRLNFIEKKVVLPISYKNLPQNFMIIKGIESNVSLIIKAKEEFFQTSNLTNLIKPVVYLDNVKTGTFSYPIEIILNTPIQDVSVKLLKNEVRLTIDEIHSSELEIKPHITGIPAKGYFIEEMITDTKKIKVKGAKNTILNLDYLTTKPLSIEGITNSLETNLFIIIPENISTEEKTNLNVQIIIKPLQQ